MQDSTADAKLGGAERKWSNSKAWRAFIYSMASTAQASGLCASDEARAKRREAEAGIRKIRDSRIAVSGIVHLRLASAAVAAVQEVGEAETARRRWKRGGES